ncbi:MAG: hypothetical protein F6K50_25500 [Moorea sp. SIO3I7]|nr:hypothetical protein [Moorena sp. SIO3I7]
MASRQRIYQASKRGNIRVVRKLQKTLMKSWSAKMIAVSQSNPNK